MTTPPPLNANNPKAYSYIRFSSPEQAKGDSKRRQLEAAEKYALEHGLILDTELKPDEGVSAYSGEHIVKGHLGEFLKLVELGKIEKGSVLVIESLDRLTRQNVTKAATLFISIIEKGIRIVTLTDGKTYDEESIRKNSYDFICSILVMARANEESETKSLRICEAWKKKRENISKKKLTSICPAWLSLNKEKNEFEIIQPRVELIIRMFELVKSGYGSGAIAKTLNSEGIEPWGRGKKKGTRWHLSTVNKILSNKALLGEYEPHTQGQDRVRRPTGNIVTDYFPRVIDEQTFFQVQELRKHRRIPRKNQTGTTPSSIRGTKLSNLFTGIVVCGYCGSSMRFQSKGADPKKGGLYLACNDAVDGMGCRYLGVRYEAFEENVLTGVRDSGFFESILTTDQNRDTILEAERLSIVGQLDDIEKKLVNLLVAVEDGAQSPSTLVDRISELECKRDLLTDKLKSLESRAKGTISPETSANNLKKMMEDVFENLKKLDGQELLLFRSRLHQSLKQVLKSIIIYPRNKEIHNYQMARLIESNPSALLNIAIQPAQVISQPYPKNARDKPMAFTLNFQSGQSDYLICSRGTKTFLNFKDNSEFESIYGKLSA